MGNGEVKNTWQQGRIESQRERGPRRAQACMRLKHWDDQEAPFKDKPEIALGQRNQTASKSPRWETARELRNCEHTREQQRWKDTKIQGQREPHTPRPLTRPFCAWLAFSSSSFLPFLVTSDLSFAAQLRDLFKGVFPTPILGGLITALPVSSAPPGKSLRLAQMALQIPLWLSSSSNANLSGVFPFHLYSSMSSIQWGSISAQWVKNSSISISPTNDFQIEYRNTLS